MPQYVTDGVHARPRKVRSFRMVLSADYRLDDARLCSTSYAKSLAIDESTTLGTAFVGREQKCGRRKGVKVLIIPGVVLRPCPSRGVRGIPPVPAFRSSRKFSQFLRVREANGDVGHSACCSGGALSPGVRRTDVLAADAERRDGRDPLQHRHSTLVRSRPLHSAG